MTCFSYNFLFLLGRTRYLKHGTNYLLMGLGFSTTPPQPILYKEANSNNNKYESEERNQTYITKKASKIIYDI